MTRECTTGPGSVQWCLVGAWWHPGSTLVAPSLYTMVPLPLGAPLPWPLHGEHGWCTAGVYTGWLTRLTYGLPEHALVET